jgi:hypothetical protein
VYKIELTPRAKRELDKDKLAIIGKVVKRAEDTYDEVEELFLYP